MPTLVYTLSQFVPFTKIASSDVNQYFTDIKTLLNTTKLDSTNVQQNGLTRDRLALGTANQVCINDGSGNLSSEAQLAISRGGLGTDLSGSLSSNANQAIIVNSAGNAFALGSPQQQTLIETPSSFVNSFTAGEALSARNAVCFDLSLDASSANIYRVFNADYTKITRRRSYVGFVTAAVSVTAGQYTWVTSGAGSGLFVASNVITFKINGRSYSVNFTTDNATTLQAVATAMATDPDVNGAVSDGSHTVTVTGKGALFINITNSTVTGGATQPTITVTNTVTPVGGAANVQVFGPLGGFTSLTPGALYYLNTGGGITNTPADTSPILVGQALSSTVLFINTNVSQFQFSTPSTFVRSHGGTTGNTQANFTNSNEQFSFVSWAAGTADSNSRGNLHCGQASLGTNLIIVDGANTSGTITPTNDIFNKNAWSTGATRGTALIHCGVAQLSSKLVFVKGDNSGTFAGAVNSNSSWNANSWSTNTAFSLSLDYPTTFNYNNAYISVAGGTSSGGSPNSGHETWDGASVGSQTAFPSTAAATCAGSISASSKGIGNIISGSTYQWSGSWSSVIATGYTLSGDGNRNMGPAAAYSSGSALSFMNGGSSAATTSISATSSFSGNSWSSSTSSSTSKASSSGDIF